MANMGSSHAELTDLGKAPVGYSLILPPGWVGIPLRDRKATDSAVRRIVDKACEELPSNFPRDKVTPYRLEIERRLRKGVAQAQTGSGLDLYLPLYERGRVPLGASFVVAEMTGPRNSPADAKSILALMVEGPENDHCESVEVAESPAVRRDVMVGGDLQEDAELASRRVDYVIPVPQDPKRWVIVSFSTVGAGDPEDEIAEATTELFDAIMTTFRWREQ
ncbi:hypothetical protein ACH4HG_00565 [Streptomyces coeruleorubidus]|uniref:hypothetical protein n=1 Tax=Streptomyces coeruleorubidus TaxID=116188 RepID=UPI0037B2BE08